MIVKLTSLGQEITENTPLDSLPLLRRLLVQLFERQLTKIDDALTELIKMIKAAGNK